MSRTHTESIVKCENCDGSVSCMIEKNMHVKTVNHIIHEVIPMDRMSFWLGVLQACAPVLIAVVTIIPTIISSRNKTNDKLEELKKEVKSDIKETTDSLKADIKATNDDVESMKKSLSDHVKEDEDDKNRQARLRILRFYDEICEKKRHSENHFEDILDDIDSYEAYCHTHPAFKNNRGRVAIDHIRTVYKEVKATKGFLTHEGE